MKLCQALAAAAAAAPPESEFCQGERRALVSRLMGLQLCSSAHAFPYRARSVLVAPSSNSSALVFLCLNSPLLAEFNCCFSSSYMFIYLRGAF